MNNPNRGFTLMEVLVAVLVMVVLTAYTYPQFSRMIEESNVDIAAADLETIWNAERVYRAKYSTFTTDINGLIGDGLLEPRFSSSAFGTRTFNYSIEQCPGSCAIPLNNFDITASRISEKGGGAWSGNITINELGEICGYVESSSGHVTIYPKSYAGDTDCEGEVNG